MKARALPERDSLALGAAALVGLTLLAYGPALGAGFVWDDDAYVTGNRTLRTLAGLWAIWTQPGATPQYYPLTFTSFWLEYQLWGPAPAGYHIVNVLLHAANATLVWRLLRRLTVPAAWLAAAVFALHPVHVESVAWVTERKNVLSGLCYLGALGAVLPLVDGRVLPARRYWTGLALFVAALLGKTVTCSLPVVVLLLTWWRTGRVGWRELRRQLPFLAVGAALAGVTVWMERAHVGAVGQDWHLSLVARGLLAGRVLWFYVASLVWPSHLTFIYPRWTIDAAVWWQYVYPLMAVCAIAGLWMARARLGRGPLAAALAFAATLGPALGFIDVFPMRYSFVADHFQYLASLFVLVPLVVLAASRTRASGIGVHLPVAGLLAVLGALTWRQAGSYVDLETLWRDTLAGNPAAWMAHNNLGLLLAGRGRIEEAKAHYAAALETKPDDAFAMNNLGNVLATEGRLDEARAQFEAAVRAEPGNVEAHNNLGNAHAAQGDLTGAVRAFETAIRLRPRYADAHNNLANVLAAQGRTAEAMAHYRDALRLDPDYADAHHNLGLLLEGQGRLDDAGEHFAATLRVNPRSIGAHAGLGGVYLARGDARQAVRHLEEAIRLGGGQDPLLLDRVSMAYARLGRRADAIAFGERAAGLARGAGDTTRADAIAERVRRYREGSDG